MNQQSAGSEIKISDLFPLDQLNRHHPAGKPSSTNNRNSQPPPLHLKSLEPRKTMGPPTSCPPISLLFPTFIHTSPCW